MNYLYATWYIFKKYTYMQKEKKTTFEDKEMTKL